MAQGDNEFTSLDEWLREEGIYAETLEAAQAKVEALRIMNDSDAFVTTFPCNHPRTPGNTKPNGTRPGGRCRTCQRVHERESQRKRREKASKGSK